jgi:hypothetical protein
MKEQPFPQASDRKGAVQADFGGFHWGWRRNGLARRYGGKVAQKVAKTAEKAGDEP